MSNDRRNIVSLPCFRNLCEEEGIVFQAYASLGAGSLGLIVNETVMEIAKDNNVSQAQVVNPPKLKHAS